MIGFASLRELPTFDRPHSRHDQFSGKAQKSVIAQDLIKKSGS